MTSETKTFIEPSDIVGVDVECPNCRTHLVFEMETLNTKNVSRACPNCDKPFFDLNPMGMGTDAVMMDVSNYLQFLKCVSAVVNFKSNRMKLKLQILGREPLKS